MFDIVGMGNAIVDLTTKASENQAFMNMSLVNKGGYFHTREDEFEEILLFSKKYEANAGGSVANSLKAFAALGGKACFIGKIGMDKYGQLFADSLKSYNITSGLMIDKDEATGCSVVLVHDDGEKSICAKRRATKIIPYNGINWGLVEDARCLFLEGYWLDDNLLTVKKIINKAKEGFVKVAFTLADPLVVEKHHDFFAKYMKSIDILIGNENEFQALGNIALPPLAVQTCGAKGVEVYQSGRWLHFEALKAKKIVNTTGAGDAFAGGFLFAYLNHYDLENAVHLGQKCSLDALSHVGASVSLNFKPDTLVPMTIKRGFER